jgi:hypothetical protein
MNRLLKYVSLLAVCFLVMAFPPCEDESYPVDARRDHIYRLEAASDVFTSESLSDKNLEAFEFKAVEKLMDYADYLGIIHSKGYAESSRQQARQNVAGFFKSDKNADAAISFKNISGPYDSFQILVDSVDIIDPLSREADTRHTGNMIYAETILGINTSDTVIISHSHRNMEIVLQMDYKDFGENSLLVWEVLLGEITTGD